MKKSIIALLFAIIALVTGFNPTTAIATPLKVDRSFVVFHADREKTFAVNEDLFTFKNFKNIVNRGSFEDFSVVEITNAPRSSPGGFLLKKHVINVPENFYALAGEFEFFGFDPNKTTKVNAGDIVYIPAGVPYGYKNVGSEPGKILLMTPSKGFENFIEEIGTKVPKNFSPDSESVRANVNQIEPSMNKIASIASKYGIEFLN
ncbi:cupin domain-containing protein [Scytonema sp. NUACC26]|uniref:cupin domain-containing protein n=1 Tax=Scytonema sp. NUACC26 TaxID=3140176 RepID=UPI0034DBE39B